MRGSTVSVDARPFTVRAIVSTSLFGQLQDGAFDRDGMQVGERLVCERFYGGVGALVLQSFGDAGQKNGGAFYGAGENAHDVARRIEDGDADRLGKFAELAA